MNFLTALQLYFTIIGVICAIPLLGFILQLNGSSRDTSEPLFGGSAHIFFWAGTTVYWLQWAGSLALSLVLRSSQG